MLSSPEIHLYKRLEMFSVFSMEVMKKHLGGIFYSFAVAD